MKIPNNGRVRQFGTSDLAGELRGSFGIDLFTSPGKISLSRPMKRIEDAQTFSDDRVQALTLVGDTLYASTDENLYSTSTYTAWSTKNATLPDNVQDIVYFDGELRLAGRDDIGSFDLDSTSDDDWWSNTLGLGLLSTPDAFSAYPHVMEVDFGGSEALLVTDGSSVHRYVASSMVRTTVDIHSSHTASCVKPGIRRVWIGSYTEDSGQAYVYQWDGSSSNYTQAFPAGSSAVLAMELVNDTPVIINELGEIKMFNNAGFVTVATLPFRNSPVFSDGVAPGRVQDVNNFRPVHPKGMRYFNDRLYVFTNYDDDGSPLDVFSPNGIWEVDLSTGSCHNRFSIGGHQAFAASSPLLALNNSEGRFICAPTLTGLNSSQSGVWIEDLTGTTACGVMYLPEVTAEGLLDSFDQAHIKADLGDAGSIVIKYRDSETASLPIFATSAGNGSWTSSNTIVLPTPYPELADFVAVGLELTVPTGSGVGIPTQVTSIDTSDTTTTVTVADNIGTVGQSAEVVFDQWTPLDEYTAGSHKRFGPNSTSTFVALKFVIKGSSGYPQIREVNIPHKPKTQ